MFYAELKRGFEKTSFKISILIGLLFVLVHVRELFLLDSFYVQEGLSWVEKYLGSINISSFDKFMLTYINMPGNMFIVLLPLICSISYSDSYVEDSVSGMNNFIYTREKKEIYAIYKYIVNFIVSGIVITIPLIVDILICAIIFPSFIRGDYILGAYNIPKEGVFSEIYYSNPIIYIILSIFLCFIYAGAYSSIALSAGLFIKKRFIVIIVPFLVSMFIVLITNVLEKTTYNHTDILFNFRSPLSVIIIHFLIIFIPTFLIFYFGVKKHEL